MYDEVLGIMDPERARRMIRELAHDDKRRLPKKGREAVVMAGKVPVKFSWIGNLGIVVRKGLENT